MSRARLTKEEKFEKLNWFLLQNHNPFTRKIPFDGFLRMCTGFDCSICKYNVKDKCYTIGNCLDLEELEEFLELYPEWRLIC